MRSEEIRKGLRSEETSKGIKFWIEKLIIHSVRALGFWLYWLHRVSLSSLNLVICMFMHIFKYDVPAKALVICPMILIKFRQIIILL